MNRLRLSALNVPERCHDGLLDEWDRELAREAVRLATLTLKENVDNMPREARTAVNATLCALTVERAAKQAGVSRKTICRAIDQGKIRAVRGSTGLWSLDRPGFLAWAQARMPAPSILSKDA